VGVASIWDRNERGRPRKSAVEELVEYGSLQEFVQEFVVSLDS
jgi:hypothetical protein